MSFIEKKGVIQRKYSENMWKGGRISFRFVHIKSEGSDRAALQTKKPSSTHPKTSCYGILKKEILLFRHP